MRNRSSSLSGSQSRSSALLAETTSEETMTGSPDDSVLFHPHRFEQDIRHQLMCEPNLNFTSLTVRRIQDGVFLEGILETDDEAADIESLVRRVSGVQRVLNSVVIRRPR